MVEDTGILRAVAAGVVAIDVEGRIAGMNPAAEALTGWSAQAAQGRPWAKVLRFPQGQVALGGRTEAASDPQSAHNPVTISGYLEKPGGEELPILVHQLPWHDQAGEWVGHILTLHDMSSVRDQIRLREELLTNIAHEFRTPLASLVASIEMLDTEHHQMCVEEIDQLLGSLHRTVRRMESLVNNILDEASLRAGRLQIHPEPVDLVDIIEGAVLFIQPMLDQRGQRLEIHLPEDLEAVRADEQRIVQVLINLLDNASKYSPSRETITLTVTAQDGMARVSVQDRGPGIAQDKQVALFQRFSRLPRPASDPASGTGLGLAIAKAIVERHGGKIELKSQVGAGTVTWFTLPQV